MVMVSGTPKTTPGKAAELPDAKAFSRRAPKRHVLVAEDEPAFERLISRVIASLNGGWHLHVCRTGKEAVAFLNETEITLELALVDLGLPYVSGIEVIRQAHERFPEMPIAVISVISAESSVLAAIQAGACGYILKDDNELSISQGIDQILQGNYPISISLAKYLFKQIGGGGHAPKTDQALPALSPKELELLEQLSQGYSYGEAAKNMGVTLSTIQSHIQKLYRKLDVRSQTKALMKARQGGLLGP